MTNRLLPVIFILIALGIFFGYVNPTYSAKVKTLRDDIRGYDAALAAARAFNDKQAELKNQRNALSEEAVDRIKAFLPDGVDNVQLILDLNALAVRSGIELSDFDVGSSEEEESGQIGVGALESDLPYESLDITLTGVGTYEAFKKFLSGIEWSLRPLDLVELTVDDSPTGVYTYGMTFRIYWLR